MTTALISKYNGKSSSQIIFVLVDIVHDLEQSQYSRVLNKSVVWNKHVGWKISLN